ncbi:MAG: FAD-dependent oxidoreductase [Proteobacteria bacterium]|nr:NAD(P)/FAD-dependent oxidoreductase [Desulfobacteraceae bacterium]MBU4101788.1 FAD-dependent oxidoreductase [Pseudomonadota bacterium]
MKNYLIIGNGVAGSTAAEFIRKHDAKGKITIVTDEALPFYYRIRLNEYISADISEQTLVAKKQHWFKDNDIDLKLRTRIVGAEPRQKMVVSENKQKFYYDLLLIATGSHSFVPPIKGYDLKGVFTLRTIKDAHEISDHAKNSNNVVLIGGGLLGIETGNALKKLGKKVTVVEFSPRLLPRQLDADGAFRLQQILEEMGFSFRIGAKTLEIIGDNQTTKGVLLEGGEVLAADMIIISAGVRSNLELADALELEHNKGIKVDEHMRTTKADIYSAGDVAEFKEKSYGIWPAAMEQGKIAGTNMAGGDIIYKGTTMANILKLAGIDLASAGNIDPENIFESKIIKDEKTYKKIVINNDRIIGCIMLGDKKGFNTITKAIHEKYSASEVLSELIV